MNRKALVDVFPTRVGVDRRLSTPLIVLRSFPHTRGGGPEIPNLPESRLAFSPHAWGWTVKLSTKNDFDSVFPTRVGVDRLQALVARLPGSFPHTRGGGPYGREILRRVSMFSPHAWGWTETHLVHL